MLAIRNTFLTIFVAMLLAAAAACGDVPETKRADVASNTSSIVHDSNGYPGAYYRQTILATNQYGTTTDTNTETVIATTGPAGCNMSITVGQNDPGKHIKCWLCMRPEAGASNFPPPSQPYVFAPLRTYPGTMTHYASTANPQWGPSWCTIDGWFFDIPDKGIELWETSIDPTAGSTAPAAYMVWRWNYFTHRTTSVFRFSY